MLNILLATLFSLTAYARLKPAPQTCELLFEGRNAAIERAWGLLADDFVNDGIATTQLTHADAELVQMLSVELEKPLAEVAHEYENGIVMLGPAYNSPGKVTNDLRLHSAQSLIYLTPWLKESAQNKLRERVRSLILGNGL